MTADEVIKPVVCPPFLPVRMQNECNAPVHAKANKTGNGTYNNPLTAASAAPGEFNECEMLYLPYLQKYVIIEDTCAQCSTFLPS